VHGPSRVAACTKLSNHPTSPLVVTTKSAFGSRAPVFPPLVDLKYTYSDLDVCHFCVVQNIVFVQDFLHVGAINSWLHVNIFSIFFETQKYDF
jgi:hypothetical protein